MDWHQNLVVPAPVPSLDLVAARGYYSPEESRLPAVGSRETSLLVGQVVEQADPIDRQLVLAAPKIDLNQPHCHMLWEQVDYSVDPMLMPPAAVVPRDLVMLEHPKAVVHPYLLHFDFPIRLVVAGPDFVIPTRQAVVEQGFALPSQQLVAVEQDFAYPTQLVAVEQGLALPSQQLVAVEQGLAFPSLQLAAVEQNPGLPRCWAVALVDPKDWQQAYPFLVDSTPPVQPVDPGAANPMFQGHLLVSSYHCCGIGVGLQQG